MAAPDYRPALIVSILNAFSPKTGFNVGQLITRADGTHKAFGDTSLLRAELKRLAVPLSPLLTAALEACDAAALVSSPIISKRSRKRRALCSEGSRTADGAE
jgi:hypothetical protein